MRVSASSSTLVQVQRIIGVIGAPPDWADAAEVGFAPRADALAFLRALPGAKAAAAKGRGIPGVPWERVVPHASRAAVALLGSMLERSPARRASCRTALAHAWFAGAPALPCAKLSRTELLTHARAAKVPGRKDPS